MSGRFGLILLVALCLAKCDSNGPSVERPLECIRKPVEGTLRPLEVGNRWDYELLGRDGSVSFTFRETVTERLDSLSVDGTPLFVISYVSSNDTTKTRRAIWTNLHTGLQQLGILAQEDSLHVLDFTYPYPATVGDIFHWSDIRADSTTGELVPTRSHEFEVVNTSNTLSVPFGDFKTIVYEEKHWYMGDFGLGPFFYQFAPGIGMISRDAKRFATVDGPEPSWQTRLIDYCLMQ